jgi:hypothetical protein
VSRPGGDDESVVYPEHGRLFFQCARCGKASRRLDRFYAHIRKGCFRVELDRAPGATLPAEPDGPPIDPDDLPIGFVPVYLDDRRPA